MAQTSVQSANLAAIASEALSAIEHSRPIVPFTSRPGGLSQEEADRIRSMLRAAFERRGERILGRKIGFTNRRIWTEYGVSAPNWGYITDRTTRDLADTPMLSAADFVEPKIEPEIMFGLSQALKVGMDEAALLECVEWVAFGYEIVQSIFPGWKFAAADTGAANAMHGALLIGPRHPIAPRCQSWLRELSRFTVALYRNGKLEDRGAADNVLDGPLDVLRHLTGMLAEDTFSPPLAADEIVSTGTLTRAFPVAPGETWTAQVEGIPLEPISLRFA